MNKQVYNVGELRSLIKESSQEFNPKLGVNVEKDDKDNNGKSYKEAEKKVEALNGGLTPKKREIPETNDQNRGMSDLSFSEDPSKEYKSRVKAQIKGYNSELEEDNDIDKSADFEGNELLYNKMNDNKEKLDNATLQHKKSGLTAREYPEDTFKSDNMFENKKVKHIKFKKTTFLSESHMVSKIPVDYKIDGLKFIMEDNSSNEYLVEWSENKPNVVSYTNKNKLNEQMDRIKDLFGYKSSQYFDVKTNIVKEEKMVGKILSDIKGD